MDIALGLRWPSIGSFRVPHDFTGFDASRDLEILVEFDPSLVHDDAMRKSHAIHALRVSCRPYKRSGRWGEAGDLHVDFDPLDEEGEVPMVAVSPPKKGQQPNFRQLNVGTALRDQARVLVIDHRRDVMSHLPSRRGSALARLLEPARKALDDAAAGTAPRERFQEAYEAALEALRTDEVRKIESTIARTAKRMLGFLGTQAVQDLDVSFTLADPANPLSSLRLVYRDGALELPAEQLGLGVQSALVIGTFEALRELGDSVGTIVIEEPEMYLHPQAQRYFYSLLQEMVADGKCQVVYATHSPIFADMTRFEGIRLMRREPGEMTRVTFVQEDSDATYLADQREKQKLGKYFDPGTSEALFARRVLLVEGHGDELAAKYVSQKLELDLDAENLSVIACGSKNAIPFHAKACGALGIPFVVLHDRDIRVAEAGEELSDKDKKLNDEAMRANEEIGRVVQADSLFVLDPSLEDVLGVGRNASDKPRRVLEALEGLSIDEMPQPLIDAVKSLGSII